MLKVGITADWQETQGGVPKMVLNRDYFEWLRDVGLSPAALPALPGSEAEALSGLDALLLSGGGDIQPRFYGADPEPLPSERYSHADRAAFEFGLVWRCVKMRLPLLGVCLGCQTINAALGGDLIRHLEDPHERHKRKDPARPATRHRLRVEGESLIGGLYPSPDTRVHSSHHQAVGRLASGFRAVSWGPDDVIEGIESPDYPWVVGVQWHPERMPRSPFSRRLALWLKEQAVGHADSGKRE